MAFKELISGLRQAESQLEKQLEGIRGAIASLDMGSAVGPAMPANGAGGRTNAVKPTRKRQRMSAAARKAVSLRMKRYWAQRRKAKAKAA